MLLQKFAEKKHYDFDGKDPNVSRRVEAARTILFPPLNFMCHGFRVEKPWSATISFFFFQLGRRKKDSICAYIHSHTHTHAYILKRGNFGNNAKKKKQYKSELVELVCLLDLLCYRNFLNISRVVYWVYCGLLDFVTIYVYTQIFEMQCNISLCQVITGRLLSLKLLFH